MLNCIDLMTGEETNEKPSENNPEIDMELLADKVAEILIGREPHTESNSEPNNDEQNNNEE